MKLATPIDYTIFPRERKADGTYTIPRVRIGMKQGYKITIDSKN
jgi:hypothetical protein